MNAPQNEFLAAYRGSFTSTLRWHQFDRLWELLRTQRSDGWYVYAIGEPPPEACLAGGRRPLSLAPF
ncbi:MAG: hypothetical protein GY792_11640 [Gammaproteobacteria bacterium]|nr:hypothetical protein [Gammaproteobacteria bacterium]